MTLHVSLAGRMSETEYSVPITSIKEAEKGERGEKDEDPTAPRLSPIAT